MGLKINIEDIPVRELSSDDDDSIQKGKMRTRKVFGKDASLGLYERGEYQTSPHRYTAEQYNYILEGKVWWFVEDEAYLLTPGDFHRVPSDAIHWAKSEEPPIKMIEAHTPPLEAEAGSLFADDETPEANEMSRNLSVEVDGWEEKQREMIEQYYERNPDDR